MKAFQFNSKNFIQRLMIFAFIVIIIGVGYSVISPQGIPIKTPVKQISIHDDVISIPLFKSRKTDASNESLVTISAIDLTETRKLFFSTANIFLDARNREDYINGHIPGAINIPINELDIYTLDFAQFESEQTFVCYCNDESCDLAMQLAVWLEENAFSNIYYFSGGWEMWQSSDNQISRGVNP